jgi:hypothetical protein
MLLFVMVFLKRFTLCPCVTKMGSIFCGPGMYFQTGQVFFFVPEWPTGEFVSIFYVGHILDDKNTLCNGCKLIG